MHMMVMVVALERGVLAPEAAFREDRLKEPDTGKQEDTAPTILAIPMANNS